MPHRDDHEAALARAAALERELAAARRDVHAAESRAMVAEERARVAERRARGAPTEPAPRPRPARPPRPGPPRRAWMPALRKPDTGEPSAVRIAFWLLVALAAVAPLLWYMGRAWLAG